MHLTVECLRSGYVAGLMTALRDGGYDMVSPGSLPEGDITQLRHDLRTLRDVVWLQLHINPRLAPSANARLCTFDRWFRPCNMQSSILSLLACNAGKLPCSSCCCSGPAAMASQLIWAGAVVWLGQAEHVCYVGAVLVTLRILC